MDSMNGTSMDNSTSMSMTMMAMLPFHYHIGHDTLWFQPWVPSYASTTFAACVGLFFLAAFYRFLAALRASVDLRWQAAAASKKAILAGEEQCCEPSVGVLQFSLWTDLPRGLLEGFQSAIAYFLMLAVMVMNAWFFIAIFLGIVVGETFFGRFGARGIEKFGTC
ncbi:Ctr copper transporter family-domain-containing protein [Sparassis latifolia]|uniref:Copper transport protein n=1 Tax=Sparassis crispa TaxID=139825 RepID=A0A401GNH8_9APHY|nr:hypothetical protein SCP_0507860 [Sparassis crispa]GBE83730.1 hypothetical protein SCP_0507860 [Sparassis crispa]